MGSPAMERDAKVLLSSEFALCAGTVMFDSLREKVCLISTAGGYMFPKGRKDVGESLRDTAMRETVEETGKICRIELVSIESRATVSGEIGYDSSYPRMQRSADPFAITVMQKNGYLKHIFWYIAVEDGECGAGEHSPMFVEITTALELLSFESDREILRQAAKVAGCRGHAE